MATEGGIDTRAVVALLLRAIGMVALLGFVFGSWRGYRVRMKFRRMKAQGIPIMEHSFLLGHLPILKRLTSSIPSDFHPNHVPQLIVENWRTLYPEQKECPGVIYLDAWPLTPPILFTVSSELASQFMQERPHIMPRAKMSKSYLAPLTHNLDLFSINTSGWKTWRGRLNPGFSAKNIITLLPAILDEVSIFVDLLKERAGQDGAWGEVFPLETPTTKLTLDVIGRAALDMSLHEQISGPSVLTTALLTQINNCYFYFNPIRWADPFRRISIRQNTRIMRDFMLPRIKERLDHEHISSKTGLKTVVDLAIKEYQDEVATTGGTPDPGQGFFDSVMAQLKLFMFAGHDTTATSICWTLHTLQKNPEKLRKVRAEHDSVFGKDPREAISQIRSSPYLINALPYTLAAVKESLRLYPVVGGTREGTPDFTFFDSRLNLSYPTDGFLVWDAVRAAHRAEHIWPRANEFLPERWLVTDPNDPLHPEKNAWRTFILGPKNCIGQELAIVEIKLVILLLVRELEIDCAWEEWDQLSGHKGPKPTIEGHRCYQAGLGTPHVKDGMPVHVRKLQTSS